MPSGTSPTRRRLESPLGRDRLGIFLLVGVAVYLVVLAVIGPSPTRLPVSAVITMQQPSDRQRGRASTLDVAAEARQVHLLQQSIDALASTDSTRPDLQDVVRHLEVEPDRSATGERAIRVTYTGQRAGGAALVNRLARQYVNDCTDRARQEARRRYDQLARQAEHARRQAHTDQTRLEAFLAIHNLPADVADRDAARQRTSGSVKTPIALTSPNPSWTVVNRQLDALEVQRAQLLGNLRPAHPRVVQTDDAIARLRKLLAETPKTNYQPQRSAPVPGELAFPPNPDTILSPGQLAELAQLKQTVARSKRQASNLHQNAQLAVDAVEQAGKPLWSVDREAVEEGVVYPSGGWTIAVSLVCGCFAGGVAALKGVPVDRTFRSIYRAKNMLPVPILGVLTTTDRTAWMTRETVSRPARALRFAGACVVVTFLVATGAVLIGDAGFWRHLANDPLTAPVAAVHRLPSLLLR